MTVFQNVRRGLIPARLTVAEVYALTDQGVLGEDDAFELIEGEIVPMAAAKASPHEMMKSRLNRWLVRAAPDELGVFIESSLRVSNNSLLEPDIALWPSDVGCREVTSEQVALIIEVAASSIAFDLREKARLYAAGGVREYWVVDANRYTIRVHRSPLDGVYVDVEEYESHDLVATLILGVAVRLDDLGLPPLLIRS
ncbi:Uma2 family endonuclease [Sphingomonas nostoxanthinifaciens]|uniref:Uma2 family endonuclease n=1 Tax=Sphingomonas nostoxanthinifaciens TaxID=2872652 RepID=UPI001CC1FB6F|nr:Uma2 family endonuclease [Sphingomonas nostoxanthinifaciens]UAK24153.1 Uma2 family endonuclease [Sphingomonas nostoxanthinifaciens]